MVGARPENGKSTSRGPATVMVCVSVIERLVLSLTVTVTTYGIDEESAASTTNRSPEMGDRSVLSPAPPAS